MSKTVAPQAGRCISASCCECSGPKILGLSTATITAGRLPGRLNRQIVKEAETLGVKSSIALALASDCGIASAPR